MSLSYDRARRNLATFVKNALFSIAVFTGALHSGALIALSNPEVSRIHYLAANKSLEELKSALKVAPLLIDSLEGKGDSLAMSAAMNSSAESLRYIAELKPELLKQKNNLGMSPFEYAVMFGSVECAEFLIEKFDIDLNADVPFGDVVGMTSKVPPVLVAVENLQLSMLKFLVERGANAKVKDGFGRERLKIVIRLIMDRAAGKQDVVRQPRAQEILEYLEGMPGEEDIKKLSEAFANELRQNGYSIKARELEKKGADIRRLADLELHDGIELRARALGIISVLNSVEDLKSFLDAHKFSTEELAEAIKVVKEYALLINHQDYVIENFTALRKAGAPDLIVGSTDVLKFKSCVHTIEVK